MSNKINDILNEVKDAIDENKPIDRESVFENSTKVEEIEKYISVFHEKVSDIERNANDQKKFVKSFVSNEITNKEKLSRELSKLRSDISSLREAVNNIVQDDEKLDAMVNRIEQNRCQIESLETQVNSLESENLFSDKLKVLEEKISILIPCSDQEFTDETSGIFQQILDIKQNISNIQTLFNKDKLSLSNKIDSNARKNNNFEFMTKMQLSELEEKINELNESPYFEDLREKILEVDKRIFALEETKFSDSNFDAKIKKIEDSVKSYSTETNQEIENVMHELKSNGQKFFDIEVETVQITKEINLLKENKKIISVLLDKFNIQTDETENIKDKILQITANIPMDLQKQLSRLKSLFESTESKISSYSFLLPRINEVSESNSKNVSEIFNLEHGLEINTSKISNLSEKINILRSLVDSQKIDLYNLSEIVSTFSDLSAKNSINSDNILSLEQKTNDVDGKVNSNHKKIKEVETSFVNYYTKEDVEAKISESELNIANNSYTNREVDTKLSDLSLEIQNFDVVLSNLNDSLQVFDSKISKTDEDFMYLTESLNAVIEKTQKENEEIEFSIETLGNGLNSLNATVILSNESHDSKLDNLKNSLTKNIDDNSSKLSMRISELEESGELDQLSLNFNNYVLDSDLSSDKLRKRLSTLENDNSLSLRLNDLENNNDIEDVKSEITRLKLDEENIKEHVKEMEKNSNELSLEVDLINYKIENPNTSDIDKLSSRVKILEHIAENQNSEITDELKTQIEILSYDVSNPDTSKIDELKLRISNLEHDIDNQNKKLKQEIDETNNDLSNINVDIENLKMELNDKVKIELDENFLSVNRKVKKIEEDIVSANKDLHYANNELVFLSDNLSEMSLQVKEYNSNTDKRLSKIDKDSYRIQNEINSVMELVNLLNENTNSEDVKKIKADIGKLNKNFLSIEQDLKKQLEMSKHTDDKILNIENDLTMQNENFISKVLEYKVQSESSDKNINEKIKTIEILLSEYEVELDKLKGSNNTDSTGQVKIDHDVQVKKVNDKYMFESRVGGFNIVPGFNAFQNKTSRTSSSFMAEDNVSFYFNNNVNFKSAKFYDSIEASKIESQKISTKNISFTGNINGYSIEDLLNKASFSTSKTVEANMTYSFDVPKIVSRVELIDSLGFCIPSSYETFVWSWTNSKLVIKFFEKISRSETGEYLTMDSIIINVYS